MGIYVESIVSFNKILINISIQFYYIYIILKTNYIKVIMQLKISPEVVLSQLGYSQNEIDPNNTLEEATTFKVIEKKYENKNIHFVSLSIDERNRPRYNYEAWRKMIVEKDLGGIQLFADNAFNSKFTKAYGIDSIPRFLLIDPEGNIVSGNAPRPSDPKLVELFNSLGI